MKFPALAALLLLPGLCASGAGAAAAPGSTFTDCADCPTMVVVPAGSNEIGSTPEERLRAGIPAMFGEREGPRLRVTIAKPYAISATEVTRGMYAAFVAATRHPDPADCAVSDPRTFAWAPKPGYSWRNPGYAQTDAHPVVCISHNDAAAFAAWLAKKTGQPYRLPSEAEWELAARGGTTTAWYWGDAPEAGCEQANLVSAGTITALGSPPYWLVRFACQNPRAFTLPVGSFAPNPYGLRDMIGNAFEWVADCASTSHTGGPTEGSAYQPAGCQQRFLKGGAFHTPFWLTRAAVRGNPLNPDQHMNTIGFRVTRSLD